MSEPTSTSTPPAEETREIVVTVPAALAEEFLAFLDGQHDSFEDAVTDSSGDDRRIVFVTNYDRLRLWIEYDE